MYIHSLSIYREPTTGQPLLQVLEWCEQGKKDNELIKKKIPPLRKLIFQQGQGRQTLSHKHNKEAIEYNQHKSTVEKE